MPLWKPSIGFQKENKKQKSLSIRLLKTKRYEIKSNVSFKITFWQWTLWIHFPKTWFNKNHDFPLDYQMGPKSIYDPIATWDL